MITFLNNQIKNFYGDYSYNVYDIEPWAYHGGNWFDGKFTGKFSFHHYIGNVRNDIGSRLVCGTTI